MLDSLSFEAAGRLGWIAVPVLVALAYVVAQHRRRGVVVRFTNLDLLDEVAPERPGIRRHLPAVAAILGLVALVLAVARPAVAEDVAVDGATVVLALDASNSMAADDVAPDRLRAMQAAASEFVDDLPEGARVAVVAFDERARVLVMPTTDHAAAVNAIAGIGLGPGTAIGDAIVASLDALAASGGDGAGDGAGEDAGDPAGGAGDSAGRGAAAADGSGDGEQPAATIVLLSDGETTAGLPNSVAARRAEERGVPVTTIAFGTDEGVIADPRSGAPVPVPVNRAALEAVAESTGGEFFPAYSAGELRAVYDEIAEDATTTTVEREITDVVAGAALALFALAAVGSLLWAGRVP